MATECIAQVTFGCEPNDKPIVALFDMPQASSDGGAILLKGLDTQFQLTKRLAACVSDGRQPGKVQHQTLELLRQRVFGLACRASRRREHRREPRLDLASSQFELDHAFGHGSICRRRSRLKRLSQLKILFLRAVSSPTICGLCG